MESSDSGALVEFRGLGRVGVTELWELRFVLPLFKVGV